MSRTIIGPFNRVEGDLEVQLEMKDNRVEKAFVVAPLYRGFEHILYGKHPNDSLVYTPRICGICSVSQSMAAAKALGNLMELSPPENGELALNIILATENIADHLTHFYMFFMTDFCRDTYKNEPWFADIHSRFKAIEGAAVKEMLPARAAFMNILGILAGKWPHSLAIQPGGTTRNVEPQEKIRLLAILASFRNFLEETLYGCPLEEVAAIQSSRALDQWIDKGVSNSTAKTSDFRAFLQLSKALELSKLGHGPDLFMSNGAYQFDSSPLQDEMSDSGHLLQQGLYKQGQFSLLNTDDITEDVSHSWMVQDNEQRHPFQGVTIADKISDQGYSWCKAPRLLGQPAEVGALARQLINGHPLFPQLLTGTRGNVEARIVARVLEIASVTMAMEKWIKQLTPKQAICSHSKLPKEGMAFGLVEAARGALGHWLQVRNNHILNYQIIAPTTWNFSPRDNRDIPGPLEQALENIELRENEKKASQTEAVSPVNVQHVVRSFDPCMVCTVH